MADHGGGSAVNVSTFGASVAVRGSRPSFRPSGPSPRMETPGENAVEVLLVEDDQAMQFLPRPAASPMLPGPA
jgi:hypothetical protein